MEETLFWVVVCGEDDCNEITVTDHIELNGHQETECPKCRSGRTAVKEVVPSTFDGFLISTNVVLWQLFSENARNFR